MEKGKQGRRTEISLLILLALLWCGGAAAEAGTGTNERLEDITVTANKMEEDIQQIPQSITVIDEAEIDEKGIKGVFDVIAEIPNMLVSPHHGNAVNFRGINPSLFTSNNPVVIYIDGVAVSSRYAFEFPMSNVQRIEVLRGPQGSLYGKDATGAVINVVTKDAGNVWAGKMKAEYGSWNSWYGLANINGPLVQNKIFVGLNGQYSKTDGWQKNVYPGMNEDASRENEHALNGYLLFTPTDRLRARLSLISNYQKYHNLREQALLGKPELDAFDRDQDIRLDTEPETRVKTNSQSLSLAYDFDSLRLESITTHRKTKMEGLWDADFGDSPLFAGLHMFDNSENKSLAEEIRLSSRNNTGLRWVAGIYLEKEDDERGPYGQEFPNFNPVTGDYLGAFSMNSDGEGTTKTQAVFGQTMIPLGQNFELTLGGRFQRIKKDMHMDMYFLPVGSQGLPMFSLDVEKTWKSFLPKAGLSWFLSNNWTAFASYSQGYMPGGFNFFSMGGSPEDNTFEPQKSTNYEIGLKAKYDSWRMGLTAFYMDIRDIHVYKNVNNMFLTDNAEKAHSQGVELEGAWLPLKGLEISGAFTVMQTEYDDFDAGNVRYDGEHIEGSPSYSARIGISYYHSSGFYGRADFRHVGNVYYYDAGAERFLKEDPYTVGDLKFGYLWEGFDFYAFIKNITDEEYINSFRSNPMVSAAGFNDPRSFGVGLSYNF